MTNTPADVMNTFFVNVCDVLQTYMAYLQHNKFPCLNQMLSFVLMRSAFAWIYWTMVYYGELCSSNITRYKHLHIPIFQTQGPVFCLSRVSSGCAWSITGHAISLTWPVIGWSQAELTSSKKHKTGSGLSCRNSNVTYDKDPKSLLTMISDV